MVLVPFLFYCSPLGVTPIRGVTNVCDNRKGEEQKYKHWHSAILCYCIPDTLLARDARNTRSLFCETRRRRSYHVHTCDTMNGTYRACNSYILVELWSAVALIFAHCVRRHLRLPLVQRSLLLPIEHVP